MVEIVIGNFLGGLGGSFGDVLGGLFGGLFSGDSSDSGVIDGLDEFGYGEGVLGDDSFDVYIKGFLRGGN